MSVNFGFDPTLILTVAALLFGVGTGGTPIGGGVQIGATWKIGKSITVGVNPYVSISTPAVLSLATKDIVGITLGGTTLIAPPEAILERWKKINEGLIVNWFIEQEAKAFYKKAIRYEVGHWHGWNSFGLKYGFYAVAEPCLYDPLARLDIARKCGGARQVVPWSLPVRHYAFSVEVR